MSNPHLPPEILDHIVDLLRGDPEALKRCCLVSKSWIPRTRKFLFAEVKFRNRESMRSWMETFPDPFNSPAYHTHSLGYSLAVTATEPGAGNWIRAFSRVERLGVVGQGSSGVAKSTDSFVPLHGFSPAVKSLHAAFAIVPSSRLFNLILSFPLLEDLTVAGSVGAPIDNSDDPDGLSTADHPTNLPVFTGSLGLVTRGGMEPIVRRLLSLPGCLRFRKIALTWYHEKDPMLTVGLLNECSDTLESLKIARNTHAGSESLSVDLSRLRKLKDVTFMSETSGAEWVTAALQTITPNHRNLRRISLRAPCLAWSPVYLIYPDALPNIRHTIGEIGYRRWLELDHLLVQLSETRSIRQEILYSEHPGGADCCCMNDLLPEVTRRGVADKVKYGKYSL